MATVFRGVFLTSEQPEVTAKFYQRVALLPLEAVGTPGRYVYWHLDRDGVQLAIHASSAFADYTHPPLPTSNLTHLYFQIEDHAAFLAHLDNLKVEAEAIDDVTVTVRDPDGRMVMFGTA